MALRAQGLKQRKVNVLAEQVGDNDEVFARFKLETIWAVIPYSKISDAQKLGITNAELAKENLLAVAGETIEDENGIPVTDIKEQRRILFDETWLIAHLVKAFFAAQNGEKESELYKKDRQGN